MRPKNSDCPLRALVRHSRDSNKRLHDASIIKKKKLYQVQDDNGKYLQNSFSGTKWVSNKEMANAWEDEKEALKIANYYKANVTVY